MCLYPKLIKNRKYIPNKKNGGIIPPILDGRTAYVPVGCQKCIECKKQKSRQWQVRLSEEIRHNKKGTMVTLTFSNEEYAKLYKEITGLSGYDLDNEIATLATRRFLERWRKEYKKSVKHWLITEIGGTRYENIHIHGIIFTENKKEIERIWKYGFVYLGEYVSEKTINYIVKYVNKTDQKHKEYNSKILTSPGIGKNYLERIDSTKNIYNNEKTIETYTNRQGLKMNLPTYYRNKIYTEEEREKLWIMKLDKEERWVCGERVSVKEEENTYIQLREYYRTINKQLGYGDDEINWDRKRYERERRKLKQYQKINNRNKEAEARNGASKEYRHTPAPNGYFGDIANVF